MNTNVTLRERESELMHWEGEVASERIGHAHRSEAEKIALNEALSRLERLQRAVKAAQDAGENWQDHDPNIQVALNQMRQCFMWLDAEVQRMNASC